MNDDWYDKAMEELEKELEEGILNQQQFNQAVRDLDEDYREAPNT